MLFGGLGVLKIILYFYSCHCFFIIVIRVRMTGFLLEAVSFLLSAEVDEDTSLRAFMEGSNCLVVNLNSRFFGGYNSWGAT